jgi:hypothetical protein
MMIFDIEEVLAETKFDGLVSFVFVITHTAGGKAEKELIDRLSRVRNHRIAFRQLFDPATLFLAEFIRTKTEYMGDTTREKLTRIVLAPSRVEAEYMIHEEFANDDQYGLQKSVENIELHEALR